MRQSFSSVRPETAEQPALRPQGPVVERIAGWSATHRKTAVIGWLLLAAAVFAGGRMISSTNVPSYDAGQSGQAEQTLNRLNVASPARDLPTRIIDRPSSTWRIQRSAVANPAPGRCRHQAASRIL